MLLRAGGQETVTVQWAAVESGHTRVAGAVLGVLGGDENTPHTDS